jgi:hypothetical protein
MNGAPGVCKPPADEVMVLGGGIVEGEGVWFVVGRALFLLDRASGSVVVRVPSSPPVRQVPRTDGAPKGLWLGHPSVYPSPLSRLNPAPIRAVRLNRLLRRTYNVNK